MSKRGSRFTSMNIKNIKNIFILWKDGHIGYAIYFITKFKLQYSKK